MHVQHLREVCRVVVIVVSVRLTTTARRLIVTADRQVSTFPLLPLLSLSLRCVRPLKIADGSAAVVKRVRLRVHKIGKRDGDGREPDGADDGQDATGRNARLQRVYDYNVSESR